MLKRKGNFCTIAKTAELLSDKWTMLILRDLLKKDFRFCELEKNLEKISTRTLANKLKKLENQKIISKKEHGYGLTKTGKKLETVMTEMEKFGKNLA